MNVTAWDQELQNDPDRDYLLNGILHGFYIVDPNVTLPNVSQHNHKSAYTNKIETTKIVQKEIDTGRYVPVDYKPSIVSPIGLVPKSSGGFRLIHDCSMPHDGRSVNDHTVQCDKQSYESVDTAVDLITPKSYMAIVDIKSAYRAVAIHPSSYDASGLIWNIDGVPTYIVDTRMMFGARPAPSVFHRISQAIKRIMGRRGHHKIVAYQDDFLVVGESYEECLEAWVSLIQLIMHLGFDISYDKLQQPSQDIVFLGIRIQSQSMQVSLPSSKLDDIKACLHNFQRKKHATKRQLQSLAGKLNYAARVVRGGRTFLRRLLNAINSLRLSHHKIRLRGALMDDIKWWEEYMDYFNGKAKCIKSYVNSKSVLTDACPVAGGAYHDGDIYYTQWSCDYPDLTSAPINYKEAMMAAISIIRWAPRLANSSVYLYSDNKCTVSIINKCASRNVKVMESLRQMFWLSADYNFHVKAVYIPGENHILADTVSRLHENGKIMLLESLINNCCCGNAFQHVSFCNHMSMSTLCSVYSQVYSWRRARNFLMDW